MARWAGSESALAAAFVRVPAEAPCSVWSSNPIKASGVIDLRICAALGFGLRDIHHFNIRGGAYGPSGGLYRCTVDPVSPSVGNNDALQRLMLNSIMNNRAGHIRAKLRTIEQSRTPLPSALPGGGGVSITRSRNIQCSGAALNRSEP
jgi:hypothetical protein